MGEVGEVSDETKALLDLGTVEIRGKELEDKASLLNEYREKLSNYIQNGETKDRSLIKLVNQIIYRIPLDASVQLLLEQARETNVGNPGLARVLKTLAETDSLKGKDLIVKLMGRDDFPTKYTSFFLHKLIDEEYLDQNLKEYLAGKKKDYAELPLEERTEKQAILDKTIKLVISELGINPDKDILSLILDNEWGTTDPVLVIEKIRELKEEFESIRDKNALVEHLSKDKKKATVFYFLYGGRTHFALVNSYNSEKFKTIIDVASKLKEHPDPSNQFKDSLDTSLDKGKILERLGRGTFPIEDTEFAKEIRIDVSDSARYEALQRESRAMFGKDQIGAILKYAYYKQALREKDPDSFDALEKINGFVDLETPFQVIEAKHSDIIREAETNFTKPWKKIGEKKILNLSLLQVLSEGGNEVNFDDLFKNLEIQRKSLMSQIRQQYKSGNIEKMVRDEKIQLLEEKGRAKLLAYILREVAADDEPDEQLAKLLSEWESHLEGAFETHQELRGKTIKTGKQEKTVTLRYLDKRENLIEVLRFADSAQCCFTSTSYRIEGQNVGNAEWIARIWKDPLSFVFQIEGNEANAERREALGFVFGSFGLESEKPVVLLNGVYMQNKTDTAVESVLNTIEADFSKKLGMKKQVFASRHGGSAKPPKGYSNSTLDIYRLRSVAGRDGKPEKAIYDDLNLQPNQVAKTDNGVWHKEL